MSQNTIPTSGIWSAIAGYINDNFSEVYNNNQYSGIYDYNDLATTGTPIVATTDTWTLLTNDGNGADTNTSYGINTIPNIFNTTNSTFDFSTLSLGDSVDIRADLSVTTSGSNQVVEVDMFAGAGGSIYQVPLATPTMFKSAGTHRLVAFNSMYMGDTNTKSNAATLKVRSDASVSVVVNGWYIRVIRRGI